VAKNGNLETVMFLVKEASADVQSKDENGQTPLSWAAAHGHLKAVRFLVEEAGADIESKDERGKTALDLVRQEGPKYSWKKEGCNAVVALLEGNATRRGTGREPAVATIMQA